MPLAPLLLTALAIITRENQSTERKSVVFGRVKLEALFSHVTDKEL
jgi:hypothetical protein